MIREYKIFKQSITKEVLKDRLDSIFQGSGADVWDCDFYCE